MKYKCPRCNKDLSKVDRSNGDSHLECESCGTYAYDFVDGFWQGVETAAAVKYLKKEDISQDLAENVYNTLSNN